MSDPDLRCWLCNVRCDQKPDWAVVVRVYSDSRVAATADVQRHFDRLAMEIPGVTVNFTVTDVTEDTP